VSDTATTNGHALFDPAETRRTLGALLSTGQVTELRALEATTNGDRWAGTYTGFFADPDKLVAALATFKSAKGIYIIPNPVDPALIARANNRVRRANKGDSTSDHNIVSRRWLLVDCDDAKRPAGISATDAEHKAALKRAKAIANDIHFNYGWPDPIIADSGNGGHLVYCIDEPAGDGGLVESCLNALAAKFTDDAVKVDTTVHNAARIWKLYGTLACKGDSTEDRPHRMSRIISTPSTIATVSHEHLESLAAEAPAQHKEQRGEHNNGAVFDIAGFIARNGFELSGPDAYQGGRRWTFDKSPLCDHHGDGPFLIQFGSGALSAGCHHESCGWTWADLRARYEPKQEPRGMADLRPAELREPERKLIERLTFAKLRENNPNLKPPLVEGLLRSGETCNVISYSKVGKSWMVYGLALSIITGQHWLGRFKTTKGKVLHVDNELHKCTLAHRIPAVAEAMGILPSQYEQDLEVVSLRGNLRSLADLGCDLKALEPGEYKAIILDAKYRFAIAGVSENDNAAETMLYNELDRIAEQTQAAIVLVHHASKGDQSGKRITDVGSGAGAQSRAADCHIVLREHEEPGVVVLEAAVRSFAPVEPLALRWDFPLWLPAFEVDPVKLKGRQTRAEERQGDKDREGLDTTLTALVEGPAGLNEACRRTAMGKERQRRLLNILCVRGDVEFTEVTRNGVKCHEYSLKQ
jgi:hypothetical protein